MMKGKTNDHIDRDRKPQKHTFTDRDWRILEHIWEYDGVLADYQIKQLEFADHVDLQQTKNRLTKLFHGGYVNRLNNAGCMVYGSNVYWLTKEGAEYVAGIKGEDFAQFDYLKEPLWKQLEHDLQTTTFTLIVSQACENNPELLLYEWLPESHFRRDPDNITYKDDRGKPVKRNIIPDRYFLIERQVDHKSKPFRSRILLELDRATHPNKRFANNKVLPGTEYIKSKAYLHRFGSNTGRWIVVTTSERRLKYLKDTTQRVAGGNAQFWYFTTFDKVTVESVLTQPIWVRGSSDETVALFPPR